MSNIGYGASEALKKARENKYGAFLALIDDPENVKCREGILSGIPVAVKDNICVKNIPMTCGSKVLDGYVPPEDAFAVELLRKAGAVIIGKTNMDEFAMGSYGDMSAYGKVINPLDNKRRPGGSSSGSAAAVAAGIVPIALGSDTGGSVRLPAAYCGVYGFKPTWGAVSRRGLTAHASSLDQIGIVASNASYCRMALDAIAHKDPRDDTSFDISRKSKSLSNLKVGIWKEQFDSVGMNASLCDSLKTALRNLGVDVTVVSCSASELAIETYIALASVESVSCLARYDGLRYGRSTGDSVEKARTELLGMEVKSRIALGSAILSLDDYKDVLKGAYFRRRSIISELDKVLHEVDIILGPAIPHAAPVIEMRNDYSRERMSDAYFAAANLAGIPALVMPWGSENGLPLSIQLMAKKEDDFMLLSLAEQLSDTGVGR